MTTDTFIYLLRCGLSDTVPEINRIPTDTDWKGIMALAQRQTVLGVVADAISKIADAGATFDKVASEFELTAYPEVQTNLRINNVLVDIFGRFESQGIDCILLKGQGVASNYPNPLLRQSGDIDIYVGERQFEQARQYAHTVLDPLSNADDSHEIHYSFGYRGVSIELHRMVMRHEYGRINSKLQKWIIDEIGKQPPEVLSVNGKDIKLPPVGFNAFFLFYHIWYHFLFEGVGLRQICDWTLYLHTHHKEIDTDALSEVLKWTQLKEQWQILGCIAISKLGLPADEMPLYDSHKTPKADAMFHEIIQSGNFGHYTDGTQVPEGESVINKFWRVTGFTIRNHLSKLKYDRILNLAMLGNKLHKKTVILIRLLLDRNH